jgi:hypothetical protein
MRRLPATFFALTLLAGPAAATGSIACEGGEDDVSVELGIGNLPVLAVVGAVISVGDETWSLAGEGEYAIAVGQAYSGEGRVLVDFTDPNIERVLIRLRLVSDTEGNDHAMAGTLAVADRGAWAVTCIGP